MSSTEDGRTGPAEAKTVDGEIDMARLKSSRKKIMIGLVLGVLLAALDQTVVGTSLPKIVGDIGGFESFAWVFAAYVLAATAIIPLAGKFSDLFGRRPVYLLAMLVFLAGSILCGLAQSMIHLVICRGIQGLGGGMLFPVAAATVADLYSPAERAKLQGALAAVFGFASVIGPFVGGGIVDIVHVAGIASWRWIFYINVPLGIIAILAVSAYFPKTTRERTPSIDYLGSALLTMALVTLVLISVWGGGDYAWDSVQILSLAAISIASFASFILVERKAKEPILPPSLFKIGIFRVSAAAIALLAFSLFSVISFLPTYMQGVVGLSATYSGAVLLPLTFTTLIAAGVCGQVMNRFGYKVFILAGSLISITGLIGLSMLGSSPPIWQAIALMIYLGVGFGVTLPSFIIAVQNAVDKKDMGVATSTITLMRALGVTVGITILGTYLNQRLTEEMTAHISQPYISNLIAVTGSVENIPTLLLQPQLLALMPPSVVDGIKIAFTDSLASLFLLGAGLATVALIVSLFLESRPLKTSEEYHGKNHAAEAGQMAGSTAKASDADAKPVTPSEGRSSR